LQEPLLPTSFTGEIMIVDNLKIDGDNLSFTTKINNRLVQSFYRIDSEAELAVIKANISYYSRLKISGDLTEPLNKYNNDASFDYKSFLRVNNIPNLLTINQLTISEDSD